MISDPQMVEVLSLRYTASYGGDDSAFAGPFETASFAVACIGQGRLHATEYDQIYIIIPKVLRHSFLHDESYSILSLHSSRQNPAVISAPHERSRLSPLVLASTTVRQMICVSESREAFVGIAGQAAGSAIREEKSVRHDGFPVPRFWR